MHKSNPDYKIGIYVRNSDPKQDIPEGTIKNQKLRLCDYVEYRNSCENFGKVVQIYEDRSFSAKDMNRPELQKMIRDIREKRST